MGGVGQATEATEEQKVIIGLVKYIVGVRGHVQFTIGTQTRNMKVRNSF